MADHPPANNDAISSFDVFDTCIGRTISDPKKVFLYVGHEVFKKTSKNHKNLAIQFMKKRISTEITANRKVGNKRTAHIKDIYECIGPIHEISPFEIMRIENQVEKNLCYSIASTLDLVNIERKKGKKIIFISDMYLDSLFIKELLTEFEFYKSGDSLYVSSMYMETKRNGELYKKVVELEGRPPSAFTHYGDDMRADFVSAKRNNFNVKIIDKRWAIKDYKIFRETLSDPNSYIFNSIPRRIILEHEFEIDEPTYAYLSLFSPLLLTYTIWVLSTAKKMGIKRLYFLARDGELPFKLALLLCDQYSIEVKYLFGSRQAWNTPNQEFKNYLQNEGLTSNENWAIVDSGWALRNQKALKIALNEQNYNKKILGFYFGISSNRVPEEDSGIALSFSDDEIFFSKKAIVVESLIFGSNQRKTVSYIDNKPIFEIDDKIGENISAYNQTLHDFTLKYAEKFVQLKIDHNCILEKKLRLLGQLKSVIQNPNQKFINKHFPQLVQKLSVKDLFNMIAGREDMQKKIVWLEGCGKISGAFIFLITYLISFTYIRLLKIKHNRYV